MSSENDGYYFLLDELFSLDNFELYADLVRAHPMAPRRRVYRLARSSLAPARELRATSRRALGCG